MTNTFRWGIPGGEVILIPGTSLNNLASLGSVLGPEINNEAGRKLGGVFLAATFGLSTQQYDEHIDVWFIKAIDGINYEDGSAGVLPLRPPDLFFEASLVPSEFLFCSKMAIIPDCKFKALLFNGTSGTFISTDVSYLSYRPWPERGI